MMNKFATIAPAQMNIQQFTTPPVILANAGIQKVLHFVRRPRECGDPEVFMSLDSRLRGNDDRGGVV